MKGLAEPDAEAGRRRPRRESNKKQGDFDRVSKTVLVVQALDRVIEFQIRTKRDGGCPGRSDFPVRVVDRRQATAR
jgi:hypothetical protein